MRMQVKRLLTSKFSLRRNDHSNNKKLINNKITTKKNSEKQMPKHQYLLLIILRRVTMKEKIKVLLSRLIANRHDFLKLVKVPD